MRKTKKDIEKGLQKKYLKRITNTVRNKYKRLCDKELKNNKNIKEKLNVTYVVVFILTL